MCKVAVKPDKAPQAFPAHQLAKVRQHGIERPRRPRICDCRDVTEAAMHRVRQAPCTVPGPLFAGWQCIFNAEECNLGVAQRPYWIAQQARNSNMQE